MKQYKLRVSNIEYNEYNEVLSKRERIVSGTFIQIAEELGVSNGRDIFERFPNQTLPWAEKHVPKSIKGLISLFNKYAIEYYGEPGYCDYSVTKCELI